VEKTLDGADSFVRAYKIKNLQQIISLKEYWFTRFGRCCWLYAVNWREKI